MPLERWERETTSEEPIGYLSPDCDAGLERNELYALPGVKIFTCHRVRKGGSKRKIL